VIAALYHLLRLARAGFVFAREGVFALVDTRPLPLPAKAAVALAPPDRAKVCEKR
jgi:ubiquinone biosynthesis protein